MEPTPPYPVDGNHELSEPESPETQRMNVGDRWRRPVEDNRVPSLPPRPNPAVIAAEKSYAKARNESTQPNIVIAVPREYKEPHAQQSNTSRAQAPQPYLHRTKNFEVLGPRPLNKEPAQPTPNSSIDELQQKIEELQFLLSEAPSADGVRQLETALDAEVIRRETAESELSKKTSEVEEFRKKWKNAARELDKSRSQNQGFYQVTDNYLVDLVTHLRYNIRNFAVQYFGGELRRKPKFDDREFWDTWIAPAAPEYDKFLFSPVRRPSMIQAFLWRFLVKFVFDKFLWTGDLEECIQTVWSELRPEGFLDAGSSVDPEVEKKFQIWVANTTGLLLEVQGTKRQPKVEKHTKEKIQLLAEEISDTLDPFTVTHDDSYLPELSQIIEKAITLDKEISRQVARVEWICDIPKREWAFDPKTMEAEKGEKIPQPKTQICLIVAPGVRKRGKSSGNDFNVESLLLRMEVSCEPATGVESEGNRIWKRPQ